MVRFYETRSAILRLSFVALVVGRLSCAVAADAADTSAARPLRVEVSAPKSCPKNPPLLDRVKAHTALVREAASGEAADLLRLEIVAAREGFVASLRLSGDDALDRRVSGKTCEEVLAAVALIVALNVDATAGQTPEVPPPEASTDAAPDPPVVSRRRRRRRDAGASPPQTPLMIRPSVGTSVQGHGLGQLVIGNSIWAEGTLTTRFSPSLRLRFTRTRSFAEGPEGRPAFFRTTTGSLEGCATVWRYDRPTLELRPCLVVSGGTIEGASAAIGPREEKTRPWVTIGSLAQLRWRFFGPLVLEAGVGFDVALFRDDFFFRPGIPLYRAPAVLFVGEVGIGTTFR